MKSKISTLVGLRNNVDDSKEFYKYFRNVYPNEELVFVSYGSSDSTHTWLDSLDDKNLKYFYSEETKTLSDTYNKAAEISSKDFITFLHNDMVISPNFLENLEKHLHKDRVVGYTTVEYPIFPSPRIGKIIQDFGDSFQNFDNKFFDFSSKEQQNSKNQTEDGITFFMSLCRKTFLNMGGFDNIFNPFMSEDDDLIRRIKLKGLHCFTSRDALVYHFVSKTSRFSEEYKATTQRIEQNSNRTYIRKWGSQNSYNRYFIKFHVNNCNKEYLHLLEPWCDCIYTSRNDYPFIQEYIDEEQPNTWFDFKQRINPKEDHFCQGIDILFDAQQLNQNNFEIIRNLQDMLGDTVEGETYEVDIFSIKVNSLENCIKDLVIKG